jgi:hypothetical protein
VSGKYLNICNSCSRDHYFANKSRRFDTGIALVTETILAMLPGAVGINFLVCDPFQGTSSGACYKLFQSLLRCTNNPSWFDIE